MLLQCSFDDQMPNRRKQPPLQRTALSTFVFQGGRSRRSTYIEPNLIIRAFVSIRQVPLKMDNMNRYTVFPTRMV